MRLSMQKNPMNATPSFSPRLGLFHTFILYGRVPFPHHLFVQFPDAGLRQGFYEDNPILDTVAGNNALFDKALKMRPDLLFAEPRVQATARSILNQARRLRLLQPRPDA